MTNQDPQKILTVYRNGKRRQISQWSFDDLALLKIIKDTATRLWDMRSPDRTIIRLEDWRRDNI
jgi:hypothetical protein